MKKNKLLMPVLAVLLGFIVGAIIMLITGHNPITAYSALLQGAGFYGNIKLFGDTLLNMTPLILTGLSVAFAFRTGLFNIGAPGQMLVGGFAAILIGTKLTLPQYIHVPLVVIGATIAGAAWAYIPGLLKAKFRIHEVVSTIMMNYIANWSVYYFVQTYVKGTYETESAVIKTTASLRTNWLSGIFNGSYVNLGLLLALIAVVVIWWILDKTTFGYELKSVGFNVEASRYAGMKVNRNIILSMMIAGALAGLAGATYYAGYADNIKIGMLPAQGYDGIAVALLGLNAPVGVALAAFLLGFMKAGSLFMQAISRVPNELVPIIIATIIFFAATSLMLESWVGRLQKTLKKNEGDK